MAKRANLSLNRDGGIYQNLTLSLHFKNVGLWYSLDATQQCTSSSKSKHTKRWVEKVAYNPNFTIHVYFFMTIATGGSVFEFGPVSGVFYIVSFWISLFSRKRWQLNETIEEVLIKSFHKFALVSAKDHSRCSVNSVISPWKWLRRVDCRVHFANNKQRVELRIRQTLWTWLAGLSLCSGTLSPATSVLFRAKVIWCLLKGKWTKKIPLLLSSWLIKIKQSEKYKNYIVHFHWSVKSNLHFFGYARNFSLWWRWTIDATEKPKKPR